LCGQIVQIFDPETQSTQLLSRLELCSSLFDTIFGMVHKVDWGAYMQQKGLHQQPLPAAIFGLRLSKVLSQPVSPEVVCARIDWSIAPAEVGVLLLLLLLRGACWLRAHALCNDPPLVRSIDDSVLFPLLATGTFHSLLSGLETVVESTGMGDISGRASLLVWDILQVGCSSRLRYMQIWSTLTEAQVTSVIACAHNRSCTAWWTGCALARCPGRLTRPSSRVLGRIFCRQWHSSAFT
jgi:hypothetical protein